MNQLLDEICASPALDNPASQRALATDPQSREAMAGNPVLDRDLAIDLAHADGMSAAAVTQLIRRPFTREQRTRLLSNVKAIPAAALAEFAQHNAADLDIDEVDIIMKRGKTTLRKAVRDLSPTARAHAARKLGSQWFLFGLLDGLYSREEEREALTTVNQWYKPSTRVSGASAAFAQLLERHPDLFTAALETGCPSVVTAVAGSRRITDPDTGRAVIAAAVKLDEPLYALLALIHNPATGDDVISEAALSVPSLRVELNTAADNRRRYHPEPVTCDWSEVTDARQLSWLARRTLPNEYRSRVRIWDLPALLSCQLYRQDANAADAILFTLAENIWTWTDQSAEIRQLLLDFVDEVAPSTPSAEQHRARFEPLAEPSRHRRRDEPEGNYPTGARLNDSFAEAQVTRALQTPIDRLSHRGSHVSVELLDADGERVTGILTSVVAWVAIQAFTQDAEALRRFAVLADGFPGTLEQAVAMTRLAG